jgi:hypothetical protein
VKAFLSPKVILSTLLLCLTAAFLVNRALAPLYKRFDMSDCQAAYAGAKTHQDSLRVDLHPAVSPTRGKKYCGELRAQRAVTAADLPVAAPR